MEITSPSTSPRTITIVGHGPSLRGSGLGPEIDRHEVCRLKVFTKCHNKTDYGGKTDYVCASDSIISGAVKAAPQAQAWVYCKYGEIKTKLRAPESALVPIEATKQWNAWFQERCGYIGQGAKGRNFSIGTAAAMIAMGLGFRRVILAGCDTLVDPDLGYESTYNPKTAAAVSHIWPVENEMLWLFAGQEGVDLCALSPHGVKRVSRYTGDGFSKHGMNSCPSHLLPIPRGNLTKASSA